MGKRIISFILAVMLVVSTGADSIWADQSSEAVENTSEALTELQAGLEVPKIIEVPEGALQTEELEEVDAAGSAQYASEWDIYSTNYYYNQLGTQEKAFWDRLDMMCLQYLEGTANVTSAYPYQDDDGNVTIYYYTAMVSYAGLSKDEAQTVTMMFKYSNPQYYYLDLPVLTLKAGDCLVLTVYPEFRYGTSRAAQTKKFKSAVEVVTAQMKTLSTDLEKEKYAHDWIIKRVTYAASTFDQSAYSVFVDSRQETVCAGYSQSFQLLCNAVGIDTAVQTSIFYQGSVMTGHEWNIIKLDNNWYYVDATWDDLDNAAGVQYNYFNRSYEKLHSAELEQYDAHIPEAMWTPYLPVSECDSGATGSYIGTIALSAGTTEAPVISISSNTVSITAPAGTTVYYTIDGTDPSVAYTRAVKYTGSFVLDTNCTVKAVAVKAGAAVGPVASSTATIAYTVTLNANGGYISSKSVKTATLTVTQGNTYGTLKTPKRSKYVFTGWYTKKSGGTKITASSKVAIQKNTTLYAHWSKVSVKKASISSLKSTKAGSITVKITNISRASGYQIRYSLKSSMKSSKTKTVSENTKTITGLKKGKNYYVQVRMYQKESVTGKKYYGAWSSAKKIKTKK